MTTKAQERQALRSLVAGLVPFDDRHGDPVIAEPAKSRDLRWAPLYALPTPLLRYTEIGIGLSRSGQAYAAADWPHVLHSGGGG